MKLSLSNYIERFGGFAARSTPLGSVGDVKTASPLIRPECESKQTYKCEIFKQYFVLSTPLICKIYVEIS